MKTAFKRISLPFSKKNKFNGISGLHFKEYSVLISFFDVINYIRMFSLYLFLIFFLSLLTCCTCKVKECTWLFPYFLWKTKCTYFLLSHFYNKGIDFLFIGGDDISFYMFQISICLYEEDARLLYSLFFCTFDSFNLYFSPSFFLCSVNLSIYLSTTLLSYYFLLIVCHNFISFPFSKCLQFSPFKYDFLTCPSTYELIVFSHPSVMAK